MARRPHPRSPGSDPSWLQVDLGSPQSFNTVIIYWENAYAAQYAIQYTNGDPTVESNWQTAFSNPNGTGKIDQESFPTVQGRYIRVLGQLRSGNYGYSIYEFQVYNVAQCGGATERYTVSSTSPPSLVTDNTSGLTWTRTIETDTTPGSQFTGVRRRQLLQQHRHARSHCVRGPEHRRQQRRNLRLPRRLEHVDSQRWIRMTPPAPRSSITTTRKPTR